MDDDGIIIEDVVDQTPGTQENPSIFNLIFNYFNSTVGFVESNGWFILFALIICYFIYNKLKQRIPNITTTKIRVNEDEALEQMKRIEEARRRQQAALDAAAQKFLEEKKKKEELEALAKAEEWEKHKQGLGYKNKIKKSDEDQLADLNSFGLSQSNLQKKPKLRGSDYNPLTGSSSSSSSNVCYRPSKKGGARGG